MKTDRRAKANFQSSAPVTQFYPLPPLIFNFFGADPEDGCIGYLKTAAARERFATPMAMMREMKMGL
jgi:hypothetical protein